MGLEPVVLGGWRRVRPHAMGLREVVTHQAVCSLALLWDSRTTCMHLCLVVSTCLAFLICCLFAASV